MIVNDNKMQVKELEMDRDQLLNEKLILQEYIERFERMLTGLRRLIWLLKKNAAEGEIDDLQ